MTWELRGGDSLHLLRELADQSVDATITDPPYSSGGQHRSDRMSSTKEKYQQAGTSDYGRYPDFHGDNRDQRGMLAWSSLWLADAWRATVEGGVIALFSDWRMLPTMTDAIQCGGWIWRGVVPWRKPGARPQIGRFTAECEFVIWGSRGPMPTDRGVGALPGFIVAKSVPSENREHLTEKPVDVMQAIVRLAKPGGLILDPFAGSGTTGVAAILESRHFLGFELSDTYREVAHRRITEFSLQAERGSLTRGQGSLFDPQRTPDA